MILQMTRVVQAGLKQEKKLDIISNHLANVETTGFKGDILSFDEAMNAVLTVDQTQGDLKMTRGKLDVALNDEGFFKIETPQGLRYTRNGSFTLNANGDLVTGNGDTVLGVGGPININGTDVQVATDGTVEVDGEVVGQIAVATFENLEQLHKEGSSLFVYKGDPADEVLPQTIEVVQGALERPNVGTVAEMTRMIETHRHYESYQKIMLSFDETDSKVINEIAKV
jgi:flagellar basal-body rod protein FlgG